MPVSTLCVAFASEGGVVPALAFARRVLARGPSERVMMFYGASEAEHSDTVEELLALKDRHLQRFSLSFVTRREPDEAELITGPLDAGKVQALAAKLFDVRDVSEFVVCGPRALIDDVTSALTKLGVEPARIRSDLDAAEAAFAATPATPPAGAEAMAPAEVAASPAKAKSSAPETRVELVMDGRRRSFTMATGTESILDAAARAGIELPFSCKAGVCATCRTKLVRGEVDLAQNYALEDWELEQGFILACQAHAKTREIELTYDEK
ncbi:MAG TPA: 2Fe-2S iron-sulfur cluster-binding protein [Steroidobacteraceae bacterium]|jgi:ring-1,2-phenylacetyl-CoA epoxidase subunit PaaE